MNSLITKVFGPRSLENFNQDPVARIFRNIMTGTSQTTIRTWRSGIQNLCIPLHPIWHHCLIVIGPWTQVGSIESTGLWQRRAFADNSNKLICDWVDDLLRRSRKKRKFSFDWITTSFEATNAPELDDIWHLKSCRHRLMADRVRASSFLDYPGSSV